jgi:C-terminal processing protease CtpA/Prc
MQELEDKYFPFIKKNNTKEALAKVILNIQDYLADPHFQPPWEVYKLLKKKEYKDFTLLKKPEYRDNTIVFFNHHKMQLLYADEFFNYAILKEHKDIGYIIIWELSTPLTGINKLKGNKWREAIKYIIDYLHQDNISKLIIDIRTGAGGSNYNALYIANHFVDTSGVYMIESYENEKGTFSQNIHSTRPTKEYHYDGKIILLTNNNTCSGGEMFTLAMKNKKGLIHIGTPTLGCAGSIISKDLYNQYNVIMTSARSVGKNNLEYFKVGIIPDIIIKNKEVSNTKVLDEDKVIQKAIELLI